MKFKNKSQRSETNFHFCKCLLRLQSLILKFCRLHATKSSKPNLKWAQAPRALSHSLPACKKFPFYWRRERTPFSRNMLYN